MFFYQDYLQNDIIFKKTLIHVLRAYLISVTVTFFFTLNKQYGFSLPNMHFLSKVQSHLKISRVR